MDSSDDGKDLSEVRQPRPATRPKTRLRIKTAGTYRPSHIQSFGLLFQDGLVGLPVFCWKILEMLMIIFSFILLQKQDTLGMV